MEGRKAEAVITVIGAGLAVFGAAFYALGIVGSPVQAEPAPKAGLAAPEDVVEATTTPIDPIEIAELSDAVTKALSEGGFTERIGASELSADLPDSVVKVLIANDAVLRVAEESADLEGGVEP